MNPSFDSPSEALDLTLLATSDLHGLLSEADALSKTDSWQGLARIATYVREMRKRSANVLLLDNGDFLQGSALCDLAASLGPNTLPNHPVLQAMNLLEYDAIGLGNHEFDFGLPFLLQSLAQAKAPLVCSNLRSADQCWHPRLFLRRALIDSKGEPHTIKIGVVSVMPPQILGWTQLAHDLTATPMVQSAQRQAQQLRADGADIVIALAHTGIGALPLPSGAEHAGAAIAALPEIDAIICGHAHALFPDPEAIGDADIDHSAGTISGTPAVMPNFNGSHIGQIDLTLRQHNGVWGVEKASSKAVPMRPHHADAPPIPQDPELLACLAPYRAATQSHLKQVIGRLPVPVHSFFAGLPFDPSCAITALAKLRFAQQALSADTLGSLPIVAVASPFRCGGRAGPDHFTDVPAGPVDRQGLYGLHPFQNTICARLLSGWQIKDWLEMAASSFRQVHPDTPPRPLMDARFPGYNFDTFFGLTYQVDLTKPAAFDPMGQRQTKPTQTGRIQQLCHRGQLVDPNQSFVVLTNSYRAGGGGNIPHLSEAPTLEMPAHDMRTLVQALLAQKIDAKDLPQSPWQFAPIPNGAAHVLTSPAARCYIQPHHGLSVPVTQRNKQGFLELLLRFDPPSPNPLLAFPQTQAYISE